MIVKELIELLRPLKQDQEIRFDSYEFLGDFKITKIIEVEYDGVKYYDITDD